MTPAQLVRRSLTYYRRSHVAVALGVAVATAVITGALLVGDSVRGSLRDLVTERLGAIDYALATPQPFRAELARELSAAPGFDQHFDLAAPALLLSATVTHRADGQTHRVSGVQLLGVTADFGRFETTSAEVEPAWDIPPGEAWITQVVAAELGVDAGAELFVLLPTLEAVPADSPLGEKQDTTTGQRLRVGRVLPDEGLARFTLQPSQRAARTVFVSLAAAQRAVDQPGKANLLLVGAEHQAGQSADWLADSLRPTLDDYGLAVSQQGAGRVIQIAARQLVVPEAAVGAARRAFGEDAVQPVATYLANSLRCGERSISYSTVTGADSQPGVGPLLDSAGRPIPIADDQVVLNDWAAQQLGAEVGDQVTLRYYEPESTHGELKEAAPVRLTITAIAPLEGQDGGLTAAADPALTPELDGVTDADSINDWDLPFELVEPITQADEDYWDAHAATPKAFVSYRLARRLWSTRWGADSLLRIPAAGTSVDAASKRLRAAISPGDMGFVFLPVKQQGLSAASGTTPFDGLFFGFSMFLIASAVMLIALLYRLNVDQRARQVGVLGAIGWEPKRVRRSLTREGLVVAEVGAAVGVLGGVAYAWLMVLGLGTLWVEAIVTPFIQLHVTPRSLVIGYVAGIVAAWAAIAWSLRGLTRETTRTLLSGQVDSPAGGRRRSPWAGRLSFAALACAVGLGVGAGWLRGEAQAGAFFGSGALALLFAVLRIRDWLTGRSIRRPAPASYGVGSLALRNLARSPTRSLLTIAVVGASSFLILAIGAFRLPPTEAGTGGFAVVAQTDQPLHYDLNTPDGRAEYAFRRADSERFGNYQIESLRVYDGEDASCLNLYQTSQPRVLGVPGGFHPPFDWAGFRAPRSLKGASGWIDLDADLGADDNGEPVVPVVLDFNTAMYSLKLYGGVGTRLQIKDSAQQPVTLEVVGLLKNSLLQGDLIVSEANFLRLLPETGGYRFFLIQAKLPDSDSESFAAMLEDRLSDYGFDAEDARRRLAGFLAVQNTYLSTFQTLGALGLLLGAVGVAVVQLRNVAQRRGELALLRAAGFTTGRLQRLVLLENLALLLGGLTVGAAAAAVALAPQSAAQGTRFPLGSSAALLAAIAVVGLTIGWLATRRAVAGPLVPALRSE